MSRRTTTWLVVAACLAGGAVTALRAQEPDRDRDRVQRTRTVRIHAPPSPMAAGGWLGVSVEDLGADQARQHGLDEARGALVQGVEEESPAADAGLEEGDVIVSFDGEGVRSVAELVRLVRETPPGRAVELGLVRDGDRRAVSVEVGERPGPPGFAVGAGPGEWEDLDIRLDSVPGLSEERIAEIRARARAAGDRVRDHMRRFEVEPGEGDVHVFRFFGRPRLGVELQSLSDQLAEYFGVAERGGALVAAVREGSPAAEAGLQAGDVIVAFGGEAVEDAGELMRAVHRAEAGDVQVTVVRRGEERTLTVALPERGARGDGPEAMELPRPRVRPMPAPARAGLPVSPRGLRAPPARGAQPAPPALPAAGRMIVL